MPRRMPWRSIGFGGCGSKNAALCPDAVSNLDAPLDRGGHQHVYSRTELNHSNALASRERIAQSFPEYDMAGQQASDLLYHNHALRSFDGKNVLLILDGRRVL